MYRWGAPFAIDCRGQGVKSAAILYDVSGATPRQKRQPHKNWNGLGDKYRYVGIYADRVLEGEMPARPSRVIGKFSPSALAVFMLMTSSMRVACCAATR